MTSFPEPWEMAALFPASAHGYLRASIMAFKAACCFISSDNLYLTHRPGPISGPCAWQFQACTSRTATFHLPGYLLKGAWITAAHFNLHLRHMLFLHYHLLQLSFIYYLFFMGLSHQFPALLGQGHFLLHV